MIVRVSIVRGSRVVLTRFPLRAWSPGRPVSDEQPVRGMLHTSKEQIQAGSKLRLLEIQQLELDYHVHNCFSIGTMAAIIAAFAYNGIIEIRQIEGSNMMQIAYYVPTYCCTLVELLVVFLTTFAAILGPGYALRGPDGAILHTARTLEKEIRTAYILFYFGLFLLFPSLVAFVWAQEGGRVAVACTVSLLLILLVLQWVGMRNYNRFQLPQGSMVASHFTFKHRERSASRASMQEQRRLSTAAQLPAPSSLPPPVEKSERSRASVKFAVGETAPTRVSQREVGRRQPRPGGGGGAGRTDASDRLLDSIWAEAGESPDSSPGSSAERVNGEQAALSGYLYKLPSSGRPGAWQRRFITLRPGVLRWYASEADYTAGRPKGDLLLSDKCSVLQIIKEGVLVVSGHRAKLTLRAGEGESLSQWRRAIEWQLDALRRDADPMQALRYDSSIEGQGMVAGRGNGAPPLVEMNQDRDVFMPPTVRQQNSASEVYKRDFVDDMVESLLPAM